MGPTRAYQQLLEAFAVRAHRSEIGDVAAAVAQELMQADGAAVSRNLGAQVECFGAAGLMHRMRNYIVPASTFPSGLVQAAMIVGPELDFGAELKKVAADAGVNSGAMAPVRVRNATIGVLTVISTRVEAFSSEDLVALQAVADLVGVGLALADAEDLRASFLRDLVAGVEDERQRLVREIHDEAGQLLTALVVNLHALAEELDPPNPRLAESQRLASTAHLELQRIARGLRPSVMEELTFEQAVRRLARDHQRTHGTRVDLEFNGLLNSPELPIDVQVALYRILQEALTNAARHARGRVVGVVIRQAENRIRLIIEDDGVGFDVEAARAGVGLAIIRERTQQLAGKLTLESSPGQGTALYVEIPLLGRP